MIWFNKISSDDIGVIVEKFPSRPIPRRKSETVSVPGRNGDILFQQNAFENVTQNYDIYVSAKDVKLHNIAAKVAQWLLQTGYLRLEDSYEPDVFRMAYYSGGIDIENLLDEYGRCTITFTCRPERYLKSGEYPVTLAKNQVLINPTSYPAKPLIKVSGSGDGHLFVGDNEIALTGINGYLVIDSDIMDCYKGSENCNSKMTGEFPMLSGITPFAWNGNITGVEVTPRWYTI